MPSFLRGRSQLRRLQKRVCHTLQILHTPYRDLVLHGDLARKRGRFNTPALKMLSRGDTWQILQIGEIRFFWPSEYGQRGLRALYRDTFAPAEGNPHAFEVGGVRICPGDWVVDAGACEGFFTHYALKRGANVLMIEPVPMLAEALSRTFELEIQVGRVRLLRGVLDAKAGVKKLMIPEGGAIAASIDPDWKVDANWELKKSERKRVELSVEAYTLDGIVENGIIPKVDFLKMDIENAEVAAVQGAIELLRSQMPALSIAVYHGFLNAQIIRSLILETQSQYRVWWRGVFIRESYGRPRPYMLYASV